MRNTLNFTRAKEIVANALKKYISESISTETSVLNQNKPELIAKSLKVKHLFEKGFKDENDLKNFVCNYLKNTNHKIYISALEKLNFKFLKDTLYKNISKIHENRFPYNNYLYPKPKV